MRKRNLATLIACLLTFGPARADPPDPLRRLGEMLGDPEYTEVVLVALRSTGDKHLEPLLVALARSPDPARRAFAVAGLAEICGKDSAPVLIERVRADPESAVRISAMVRLLAMGALDGRRVQEALASSDEAIRCLAADAMVRRGDGREVLGVLRELARSASLATASSARLNLVSLGRREHLAELRRTVEDPATPPAVVTQILVQIGEEKVADALPIARTVAESDRPRRLRMQAYSAIAEAAPDAVSILHGAIRKSTRTVERINLLAILSRRPDAAGALRELGKLDDPVGCLARFELLRTDGGPPARLAVKDVLKLRHPVVVRYVLGRAEEDCKERGAKADFYVPALLDFIRSVEPNVSRMAAPHYRAARAATILADLGTPEAAGGLGEILSGRHDAVVRAVGAGLLRSKNPIACELARPLLDSPYEELYSDAALVLGSFGDGGARERLEEFAAGSGRHPAPLAALSCWYLLKISHRTQMAGRQLARQIERR